MSLIIAGAVIGGIIGAIITYNKSTESYANSGQPLQTNCVKYHQMNGGDYLWLKPKYGTLIKAEFKEGNRGWTNYEELHRKQNESQAHNWWFEHCRAVSHDYRDLFEEHMNAFVRPGRFAIMRYTFDTGMVYQSDIDTGIFEDFFRLEANFAKKLVINTNKN